MKNCAIAITILALSCSVRSAEETIRGVLEKTAKADACAQITDALNDIYYIAKSDAVEKMIAPFVGKNQRVAVTGSIENKPNETNGYINLKTVEAYAPKLPPAPTPPPAPAATAPTEKKDEKKEEKAEEKK